MAAHASSNAEDVYSAFHRVVTVQGDTPAQRAVMIAELDIGVMVTASPQPSMQANASRPRDREQRRRLMQPPRRD